MEKVTPLQWVAPSVAIPNRPVKTLPAKNKKERLHFLDMLPNLAEFRVPLNGAPIGINSCRTMQAPICLGSRGLSPDPDYSCRLRRGNHTPFGTALVPAFML